MTGLRASDALRLARNRLSAAGCPDPDGDARVLVGDALEAVEGACEPGSPEGRAVLPDTAAAALAAAVAARAERRPLAYVRGRARFRGLEMVVDQRVFVPRPETELLVEAALEAPRGGRVLEPCTGSGAVASALSLERPDLRVTASDASGDAVEVARANAERLGAPVRVHHAPWIAAVPGGPFDVVVCNPPYVPEAQRGDGTLPPELEHHEPGEAFWAGAGGLDSYHRLVAELPRSTRWVALEVGDGQDRAVTDLLTGEGFAPLAPKRNAAGWVRVVVAAR